MMPFLLAAQYDIKKDKIETVLFQATYAYQFPGKDTKTLYGNNHSIGGSVFYKTQSNWLFSINGIISELDLPEPDEPTVRA